MIARFPLLACLVPCAALVPAALGAGAAELVRGERFAWTHSTQGTHAALSGAAVAVRPDGTPLLAWIAPEGDVNHLWLVAPGEDGAEPARVDPPGLGVDSLHQAPALASGPGDQVLVSWASIKPKPEGTLFASDLRLSRSRDGGKTFAPPLRVNEDRPISHSFEGLAVASDGSVLLSWIDSREGWQKAGTYVARVDAAAGEVESVAQIGSETCVCCRVAIAAGDERQATVLWRKDFPDQVRDMVLAVSDDAGASFAAPVRVNEDRWQMPACPHRGGGVGIDRAGRIHAAWYTEGTGGRPALFFATSPDGKRFGDPVRIDASEGSIPDHVRLGVASGGILVAWEDSTAVRRRILARLSVDGGKSFGPVEQLSSAAVKAYSPALAATPAGGFAVAWTEEEFPVTRSVVQMLRVAGT